MKYECVGGPFAGATLWLLSPSTLLFSAWGSALGRYVRLEGSDYLLKWVPE